MAVVSFDFSRIFTVKFPVPGPTSMTLSVGLRFAFSKYSDGTLESHNATDCINYPTSHYHPNLTQRKYIRTSDMSGDFSVYVDQIATY